MSSSAIRAILFLAFLPSAAESLAATISANEIPFIERISPADFFLVETRLDQSWSKSSDLVWYNISDEEDWSCYALRRRTVADYDLIHIVRNKETTPGSKTQKSVIIPSRIGLQIEQAFQLFLTKGVSPPSNETWDSMNKDKYAGAWWIFLRVNDTIGIMGVHRTETIHATRNRRARAFREITDEMKQLGEVDSFQREKLLLDLDLLTATFLLYADGLTRK